MRSLFIGVFVVIVCAANAQSDSIRWHHYVGGGMQWLTAIHYSIGHDGSEIHYDSPGPFGFYRATYLLQNHDKVCFSASVFQRKGTGYHTQGGLGGSDEIGGAFSFVRVDLGLNYFVALGKFGTFLGFGGSLGFVPYINAYMEERAWTINKGTTVTQVSAFEGIDKINLTLNLDLHQEIKISLRNALVIGVRGQIETPDGFNGASDSPFWYPIRAGKVFTPYLAFRFL